MFLRLFDSQSPCPILIPQIFPSLKEKHAIESSALIAMISFSVWGSFQAMNLHWMSVIQLKALKMVPFSQTSKGFSSNCVHACSRVCVRVCVLLLNEPSCISDGAPWPPETRSASPAPHPAAHPARQQPLL